MYKKINIFLRMFANNKPNNDRPGWFNYELVFRNLLATTNFNFSSLTICFEGDITTHFLNNYRFNPLIKIVTIDTVNSTRKTAENAGWSKSVAATSEVIAEANLPDNELVYILEDDYVHLPLWGEASLDAFQFLNDNSYICLYDHNDKYIFCHENRADHWGMYADLKSKIIASRYCHWRSVPNCGLSMMMPVKLFKRDYEFWSIGVSDCDIGHLVGTKYKTAFWTPLPGLATHCIHPFISPCIDWETVIAKTSL